MTPLPHLVVIAEVRFSMHSLDSFCFRAYTSQSVKYDRVGVVRTVCNYSILLLYHKQFLTDIRHFPENCTVSMLSKSYFCLLYHWNYIILYASHYQRLSLVRGLPLSFSQSIIVRKLPSWCSSWGIAVCRSQLLKPISSSLRVKWKKERLWTRSTYKG